MDNYLETEFDLSRVLFIATANSLDTIHPALRDRMEIIDIAGYTVEEKVQIAKKYLIPKQRRDHGLKPKDLIFEDKAVLRIIEGYTRESGVRNLEQKIGALIRKIAKSIAMEEEYNHTIKVSDIPKMLGAEIFDKELYADDDIAGIVTGLAWTQVGGEILLIESSLSRGKGVLTSVGSAWRCDEGVGHYGPVLPEGPCRRSGHRLPDIQSLRSAHSHSGGRCPKRWPFGRDYDADVDDVYLYPA